VAEAADGDHVEGAVGLTVAAVVESVPRGSAGAGLDRGGGAELREGGFAVQALDVLAGGDEQLRAAARTRARPRDHDPSTASIEPLPILSGGVALLGG
jgi:hypothetical protein